MQNTPRILPCSIINMAEFLAKKCPGYANQMRAVCDFDSLPMYILTNSRQTNGASAILYPGVLSSLANSTEVRDEEVLGERYYIYDSKTDTVY